MSMAARRTIVGRIDGEILKFTAGDDIKLDLELVEADCIGSAAHATMLSRMKPPVLTPAEARRIVAALVSVMKAHRAGRFRIRLEDQDVHLAVELRLTAMLGDLGRRLHTGRSRNDQVATDLRLYGKTELLGIIEEASLLAESLLDMAARHLKTPMAGRTHLQPAMPATVGLWASAYAESLLDDLEVVAAAYRLNDRNVLGSAAGYGVPLAVDRVLTCRLLGFERPVRNVLHACHTRGKNESVILAALAQLMLTLSRLAEDIIIFVMPEFGYFEYPKEYGTGSSIMPQKVNPDAAELVRAKAAVVAQQAAMACEITRGLPAGYNRDLQEIKKPFMEGLASTRASLRVMTRLVRGLKPNETALRAGFGAGVFATDMALRLVSQGVPFREAYRRVKERLPELKAMDPDEAIAMRTHLGGPARLDIGGMRAAAGEWKKFARTRLERYHAAVSNLLGVKYPQLE